MGLSPFPTFMVSVLPWSSPKLNSVIKLHGKDSQRLGQFPKGAFEEYAQKGQILICESVEGAVLGYLLYRVSRQRAMIAHLCVDQAHRGIGAANQLIADLKIATKSLTGIGLRCRQDNHAKTLWPKAGFTAMNRKPGRGKDGHELTFWWFDHNHPDLLSPNNKEERRSRVVIDANVFFDLQGIAGRKGEEAQVLQADWVQGAIELCLTKEIHNEIDRSPDRRAAARSRAQVTKYSVLTVDDQIFQDICKKLKPLFPQTNHSRDGSDLRQVAYAAAAGISFFVTRDEALVERCDALYADYGLHVLPPGELIRRLDSLEREEDYRPARVHGTRLTTREIVSEDVDEAVKAFANCAVETQKELRRHIVNWLGKPRAAQTKLVMDQEQKPVLLSLVHREKPKTLTADLLRTARHPLAGTLLRNFLKSTLDTATREKRLLVAISDASINNETRSALHEFAFRREGDFWFKVAARSVGDFDALKTLVSDAGDGSGTRFTVDLHAEILSAQSKPIRESVALLESVLWPAKLLTEVLPTFIVPIRGEWAQHFFDEDLGSELLFGLRDDLHLGVEGVYYCSPNHTYLSAPARILWYVSQGRTKSGSMCIKACSRLDAIEVGDAEEVYRRNRRLGVFARRDILASIKGKSDRRRMALRFSMTERFDKAITVAALKRFGLKPPFMSPRRITAEQFASIYSMGFDMPV
jgi:predicted nucleic acid-binding protein/ribosomal protein S18 acetylase RimI-like enzyme